jgi:hypothetical protein
MAQHTKCQTPGADFSIRITPYAVAVTVKLPMMLGISDDDALVLEANLHNAVELVLAPYFTETSLAECRCRLGTIDCPLHKNEYTCC